MLEDGNTKTHCSEMNDDIRLYMTFETLVLISCTDDTKCKGMIRTFQQRNPYTMDIWLNTMKSLNDLWSFWCKGGGNDFCVKRIILFGCIGSAMLLSVIVPRIDWTVNLMHHSEVKQIRYIQMDGKQTRGTPIIHAARGLSINNQKLSQGYPKKGRYLNDNISEQNVRCTKNKFQLTIVIFYNLNEIGNCEYKFHSTTCWQYCVYTYTVKSKSTLSLLSGLAC